MPNLENLRAVTFHFHGQLMQRNRFTAAADTVPILSLVSPADFLPRPEAIIARPSCCLVPAKRNQLTNGEREHGITSAFFHYRSL